MSTLAIIDARELIARITQESRTIHERIEALGTPVRARRGDENLWTDATSFLSAFKHFRMPANKRLVCVYSWWPDERQSRLVVLDLEDGEELPPIPRELAEHRMEAFLSEDSPLATPYAVSLDVLSVLEDDGSPQALFERSMFMRWITELLNFGHGVYWPRHTVLFAPPPDYTDFERPRGDERPRWTTRDDAMLPSDWTPRVGMGIVATDHDAMVPTSPEGKRDVESAPFDVVVFYAYSLFNVARVYRYIDWYRDSRLLGSEWFTIAEGRGAYLV